MHKKKKKRHNHFTTSKSFPYPSIPATLSPDSTSEIRVPEEKKDTPQIIIATSFKTTPINEVTGTETEDDETIIGGETVGRTKWDMFWLYRKKLNLYILLPTIYILTIPFSGQLKIDKIPLHLILLGFIYVVIFIGGKLNKGDK